MNFLRRSSTPYRPRRATSSSSCCAWTLLSGQRVRRHWSMLGSRQTLALSSKSVSLPSPTHPPAHTRFSTSWLCRSLTVDVTDDWRTEQVHAVAEVPEHRQATDELPALRGLQQGGGCGSLACYRTHTQRISIRARSGHYNALTVCPQPFRTSRHAPRLPSNSACLLFVPHFT